ncbi:uncharacterized protein LOC126904713 [Daktulosphaira vitifoliae]|uniref:uncharacterized protein LOC126904713 n=1 Tax=Daktulosphaira vitifoliae TaxID=58002 RepID=UPI0021AA52C4|nr:uncharacterized protein LOC126904713 [Daktulosphaira vitifoliae]XP_050539897.1 uncharacterized protein LOC126904713 [Daktulosphaira vitifoliae]
MGKITYTILSKSQSPLKFSPYWQNVKTSPEIIKHFQEINDKKIYGHYKRNFNDIPVSLEFKFDNAIPKKKSCIFSDDRENDKNIKIKTVNFEASSYCQLKICKLVPFTYEHVSGCKVNYIPLNQIPLNDMDAKNEIMAAKDVIPTPNIHNVTTDLSKLML